jgi:hypothetical protein
MTTNVSSIISTVSGLAADGLTIDVDRIKYATSRLNEVAFFNATKAPELLYTFTWAISEVADKLPTIGMAYDKAKAKLERRRAVVILDEAAEILKAKGLVSSKSPNGTEEQRECIVLLDQEYQVLQDKVAELKAAYALFSSKLKDFENAYNSVKKLMDQNKSLNNENLYSGIEGEDRVQDEKNYTKTINGVRVGTPR